MVASGAWNFVGACSAFSAILAAVEWAGLSSFTAGLGGVMVTLGVAAFAANMLLVVHEHGPDPFDRVLLGSLSPRREPVSEQDASTSE